MKSVFGVRLDGNSSQHEVVGGTRMDDHKPRKLKKEEAAWQGGERQGRH